MMGDTVIRAFELPVQSVECVDGRDGWALLRECWQNATLLANWGVQELFRADVVRSQGMERLPKMPQVNGTRLKGLYGLAEGRGIACSRKGCQSLGGPHWWHGASQSISCVCKAVQKKYNAERLNVIWHRNQAICTYRYPYPWPVNGQSWKDAGFDTEGRPWVLLTLPGGMVRLTLRGGIGKDREMFARQMAQFRAVVEGNLPRTQLVIRQQRASQGCHRPTLQDGKTCRVMCKMVAAMPVRDRPGNRTMTLVTTPDSFWVAELDGRRAWIANQDHALRLVARLGQHAQHLTRLQRMSEDGKFEDRTGGRTHKQLSRLEALCLKDRRRLDSLTHELAARVTTFATRQRVGEVIYDDTNTEFCPRFPWHALRGKLRDKLTLAGIALVEPSSTNGGA